MGAGILCICIAIFVLILGGFFKKVPNQKKVKGIIDSVEFAEFDRGNTSDDKCHNVYYYYFKYKIDEKEYLLKSKAKSSSSNVVGKKRTIKYNKNNPEQAVECPSTFIYLFACIFFFFGIYAIVCSL